MKEVNMKYLAFASMVMIICTSFILAQDCEWCKRTAVLSECNNKVAEGSDHMYPSSVMGLTYKAVHPPCFFWKATADVIRNLGDMPETKIMEYNLEHGKPPDYIFKALFESGLSGLTKPKKTILSDDTTDYWNVTSRFTMELYYNGETEEFIDKWVTLGTLNGVEFHYNAMWKNHDAEMKKKNPLDVMYKFEQTPTECSVTPENETIAINDSMEIRLSDFIGLYEGKPKSFNRIIVQALNGKITNGAECNLGPDYKVFTLKDESVIVRYQAPKECDITKDRITVFNSCDILPESKWPLKKTEMKDRIAEKNINISCWDATIVIKKRVDKEKVIDKSDDSFDGRCKQHSEEHNKLNETIEASINVALELEYSVDMPPFNQTYEYYKPVLVNLTNFNFDSRETKYSSSNSTGQNCAKGGHETRTSYNRTMNKYELADKQVINDLRWILAIDNKTNKAVKLMPAGYKINYHINENEKIDNMVYYPDGTSKKDVKNFEKEKNNSFKIEPVENKVKDPTVQNNTEWIKDYLKRQGVNLPSDIKIPTQEKKGARGEINPDLLVKSGDGKTSFGGQGKKTINKPNEYGYEKEQQTYSWEMTRKRKDK
jgi:hypothetical protein